MSGKTKGITTGIEGVDEVTERLKKGNLWVIAADRKRTSMNYSKIKKYSMKYYD